MIGLGNAHTLALKSTSWIAHDFKVRYHLQIRIFMMIASACPLGGTPLQRQKKIGDFVSRASNKYASNVHAKAPTGRTDPGIKRTMKASRIQRDVVSATFRDKTGHPSHFDIRQNNARWTTFICKPFLTINTHTHTTQTQDMLNHVFDDLEAFMKLLKDKSTAWNELEKRKKKSKRKKHDGTCLFCSILTRSVGVVLRFSCMTKPTTEGDASTSSRYIFHCLPLFSHTKCRATYY